MKHHILLLFDTKAQEHSSRIRMNALVFLIPFTWHEVDFLIVPYASPPFVGGGLFIGGQCKFLYLGPQAFTILG